MLQSTLAPAVDGYLSNSPYRTLLPAVSGYLAIVAVVTEATPLHEGGPSGPPTEPAYITTRRRRDDDDIQLLIMLSILHGIIK